MKWPPFARCEMDTFYKMVSDSVQSAYIAMQNSWTHVGKNMLTAVFFFFPAGTQLDAFCSPEKSCSICACDFH